jgi:cholesterol transport system auxiliary component
MKAAFAIALLAVLAGCTTTRELAPQTFDFGPAEAPSQAAWSVQVQEMRAPEWLDGTQMLYRLAYQDPRALTPFSTSRWAGTPASMLTLRLRQQLGSVTGARCTLTSSLAEFDQTFESAQESQARLSVHAVLAGAGAPPQRLQRDFHLRKPAPTADAAGGAEAFSQLAAELSKSMEAWIAESGLCGQG